MKVSWHNSLQIVSNLAIIIGICLVIYEMRQSKSLVRAQLASGGSEVRLAHLNKLMGEEPGNVLEKACFQPESISAEDMFALYNIFNAQLEVSFRARTNQRIGNFDFAWENSYRYSFRRIFQTQAGRDWYAYHRAAMSAAVVQVADTVLSEVGVRRCDEEFIKLTARKADL